MVVDGTGISATVANAAGAIRRAAQATGASFDYLLATAKVESNLDPGEKAGTSSASGLFQFIEQTWLATLKSAGHAFGYGRYADAIVQTPSGYAVPDATMRSAVLKLRSDPAANAAMAGVFTQRNSTELRATLGRPPSGGELYIAHFLGAGAAGKLIALAKNAPGTAAAGAFPAAAAANRSIFYDRQGNARSADDVYRLLVGRFQAARAQTQTIASGTPLSLSHSERPEPVDGAGASDAFAMLSAVPVAHGPDAGAPFHSLFQTGGRHEPISPVVGLLWGNSHGSDDQGERDLRTLFQDGRGDIHALFDRTS